jgi:hypothetical protein
MTLLVMTTASQRPSLADDPLHVGQHFGCRSCVSGLIGVELFTRPDGKNYRL